MWGMHNTFYYICSQFFRDLHLGPYVDHYYRDYPTLVRTTGQVCTIDQGKCAIEDFLNSVVMLYLLVSLSVNSRCVSYHCSGAVSFHQLDFG